MSTEPTSRIFPDGSEGIVRLLVGGCLQIPPDEEAILEKKGLATGESEGAGDTEGVGELPFRIGQEWEGELIFFAEFPQRDQVVEAGSEDFHAFMEQGFVGVAEAAGLPSAAGGIGAGVEVEEGPAFHRKGDERAGVVGDGEVRDRRAERQGYIFRGKPAADAVQQIRCGRGTRHEVFLPGKGSCATFLAADFINFPLDIIGIDGYRPLPRDGIPVSGKRGRVAQW